MKERKKLFIFCSMILIFILLFGICFSKNAGEDIISGLISAGELDKKYLSNKGVVL